MVTMHYQYIVAKLRPVSVRGVSHKCERCVRHRMRQRDCIAQAQLTLLECKLVLARCTAYAKQSLTLRFSHHGF